MVDSVVFQTLWRIVASIMKTVWAAGILFLVDVVFAGVYPNFPTSLDFKRKYEVKEWWETASFYQIYPRSFKDADGDGVGDLKGIKENLSYLKEIGISATWLSPIFKSPMADFGYDISDYFQIDPIFGTMEDFDALIETSKQTGVRIILDFVPNHSSDENEWFKKSAAKDPEYKDYYVWHPGKMIDGVRHPPSNWISVFRGSAWAWHEGRQEYYLHQFLAKQPDFNFRNPKVREALKDILRFWLAKGVSGFRIDAVPHCVEVAPDADGNYPDEPRDNSNNDPDDYSYLQHIYTKDQPETLELVYEWRKVMDDWQKEKGGETRVLLTEAYSPIETLMKYYGNGTSDGAHIPFNFLPLEWLSNSSDAYHYAQTINTWMSNMPQGRRANWVMGNHDNNRIAPRLGRDRVDSINIMLKTLPDISVTYYGEEIGMTDVWISWNNTQDPAACNSNPDIYEKFSRDPERTPFQWNDGKNAGFSTAEKTWLPISDNYKTVNVKTHRGVSKSSLNIYKELQTLRNQPTFKFGKSTVKAVSNHVLAIVRTLPGEKMYVALLNVMGEQESVNLNLASWDIHHVPQQLQYELVTDKSSMRKGDTVPSDNIKLAPYEAVVLAANPSSLEKYFTYVING